MTGVELLNIIVNTGNQVTTEISDGCEAEFHIDVTMSDLDRIVRKIEEELRANTIYYAVTNDSIRDTTICLGKVVTGSMDVSYVSHEFEQAVTGVSEKKRDVAPEVKSTIKFGDGIQISLYDDGYLQSKEYLNIPAVDRFKLMHDKKTNEPMGLIVYFKDGTFEKTLCHDNDLSIGEDGETYIDIRKSIEICLFKRMMGCGTKYNTTVMNKLLDKLEEQCAQQFEAEDAAMAQKKIDAEKRAAREQKNRERKAELEKQIRADTVSVIADAIRMAAATTIDSNTADDSAAFYVG